MNRAQSFARAKQAVITRTALMQTLNNIAQNSNGDEAYFSNNLVDFNGNPVVGFKFSSVKQAQDIGNLLEKLGIKYTYTMPTLNPQVGELHIDPKDAKYAQKLFDGWVSWVQIEPKHTGNKELDAQWTQNILRNKTK